MEFETGVVDIGYEPTGQYIAVTFLDGFVRVIDIRKKKIIREWNHRDQARTAQVIPLTKERILIVGYQENSRRRLSIWDVRDINNPVKSLDLDPNGSAMIPHYDRDTGLLFLAVTGSTDIQLYEISNDAPYIQFANTYRNDGIITGITWFHKTTCDVKAVEVARGLKLCGEICRSISYTLPRKRLECFQDDVFVPTLSTEPVLEAKEWFAGKAGTPTFVDLQPTGMVPLSKAPKLELTEREKKYQAKLKEKDKEAVYGVLGHATAEDVRDHFREVAKTMPKRNRWDADPDGTQDVDEDDWD